MEATSTNPDGHRKHCPVCGHVVKVHPSQAGDSTCPRCGSLLWLPISRDARNRRIKEKVAALGGLAVHDPASNLWKLDLRGVPLDESANRLLLEIHRIDELLLTGCVFDRSLPQTLADIQQLEVLDVARTPLVDDDLQSLGRLKGLQVLDLSETSVTDRGLQHLRSLKSLWWLDLDHTTIGDAGLKGLETLTRWNTSPSTAQASPIPPSHP